MTSKTLAIFFILYSIIINRQQKYRKLKKNIQTTKSQRSDIERLNLIEERKTMGIDKIIKQTKRLITTYEIIKNNSFFQYIK